MITIACVSASVTLANAQGDDLIDAAGKGDLARVKALLDTKPDLNARKGDQPNGATALMWAAQMATLRSCGRYLMRRPT